MQKQPHDLAFRTSTDDTVSIDTPHSSEHTIQAERPFGGRRTKLSPLPKDLAVPDYVKRDVTPAAPPIDNSPIHKDVPPAPIPAKKEAPSPSPSAADTASTVAADPPAMSMALYLLPEEYTIKSNVIIHYPTGITIENGPIDLLDLSSRAYNCLRRTGIDNLIKLFSLKVIDLEKTKNLGKSTANEILEKTQQFLNKHVVNSAISTTNQMLANMLSVTMPIKKIYLLQDDHPIQDTNLSIRAKNGLNRNGINTIHQLLECDMSKIESFHSIGTKTNHEILAFIDSIQHNAKELQLMEETYIPEEILADLDRFLEALAPLRINRDLLTPILLGSLNDSHTDTKSRFACWWHVESVQNEIRAAILRLVGKHHTYGISASGIYKELPSSLPPDMLIDLLKQLHAEKKLVQQDTLYFPRFIPALELLEKLDQNQKQRDGKRHIEILRRRLCGDTLEMVGTAFGITRERVRQIENKMIRRLQRKNSNADVFIAEDRFRTLFETYQLTKDEFIALTGASAWDFGYLELTTSKNNRQDQYPEDIIHDETLPKWMRANWINYIRMSNSEKYLYLPEENHRRIARTRTELEKYVLSRMCQDEVTFDTFSAYYNAFVEAHIQDPIDLLITEDVARTRENKLSNSELVLWKQGRRLRYYNIHARDYTDLLQELQLTSYHNVEISTRKLFQEHIDLMREYDLRDEYELHNLLKKIIHSTDYPTIQFNRTPGICFGNYNRDQMVQKKLFELAPIRGDEFAAILSEETGFALEQTLTWLGCVRAYEVDGVFRIDTPQMPEAHMQLLQQHLTESFYLLTEIESIYRDLVPDADLDLISSYNLRRMGFTVNSTYAIQNYSSAANYFEDLLTQADIQNIKPLSQRFGRIMSFTSKLADLKDNYDIIEFEPYQCIQIRKLEANGVSKAMLRQYCDAVDAITAPEDYFTIASLRKHDFSHPLDQQGFGTWFYSSLLREDSRFSYTKLGGTVLFYKGIQSISAISFLQYLMQGYQSIDLDTLIDTVNDQYQLMLDKDNLRLGVKSTELYYDTILEKMYINYDVYLDELASIEDEDDEFDDEFEWMDDTSRME